jgi:hypothetical protein
MRQQSHLLGDAAAEIGEGFTDVRRVVVGLIGVLVSAKEREPCQRDKGRLERKERRDNIRDGQQLLMDLFQSIHALLEFGVVRRQFGL